MKINTNKKVSKALFAHYCAHVALLLLAIVLVTTAWASDKKGVGLFSLNQPERIAALNVAWYYTWGTDPIKDAPPEKFVPMVKCGTRIHEQIDTLRKRGRVPLLLTCNEPDVKMSDPMPVEEVVRVWPEISTLADHVGSPAPGDALGPWSNTFFRMARSSALKLDFIAIHIYGPPDAEGFLKKIDAVYEKYRMPIWITEFAVADWESKGKPGTNRYSEEQVIEFMKTVLPELEKRIYIVRYAWFGAGRYSLEHEEVRTSRLFEKDGGLTPLGRFYAEFSAQRAAEKVP